MRFFIKKSRDFWKIPFILLGILFIAFSPLIVGLIGAWVTEIMTQEPCHEGNCTWGALPWLMLISIPFAGGLLVIFLILLVIDLINYKR